VIGSPGCGGWCRATKLAEGWFEPTFFGIEISAPYNLDGVQTGLVHATLVEYASSILKIRRVLDSRLNRKAMAFSAAAAVSALVLSGLAPATAAGPELEGDSLVALVDEIVPEVVEASVQPSLDDVGFVGLNTDGVEAVVNVIAAEVQIESSTSTVTVTLPSSETAELIETSDETPVFSNGNGSSTLVFGNQDDSVTIINVTDDASSPTSYV